MKAAAVALMIYGEPGSVKSVFTEEKYKKLSSYFTEKGLTVDSILYHDSIVSELENLLVKYQAILVWVNPVEQGNDRKKLDALLMRLAEKGCFVSAHPDTILKMGTKEILYVTKDTEFGSDVKLYSSFEGFKEKFLEEGSSAGIRILKQYRGNGGNGVFKADLTQVKNNRVTVTHAISGDKEEIYTKEEFLRIIKTYFENKEILIDQPWNYGIINGMVRCYLSGVKVAGFGYQEVNALYPAINGVYKKPSQRFYYSEDCGLFRDLREIMENRWLPLLQKITGIHTDRLPVIWDADFFINKVNIDDTAKKYTLCEINTSSVSPFPESAIPYIFNEVKKRVNL